MFKESVVASMMYAEYHINSQCQAFFRSPTGLVKSDKAEEVKGLVWSRLERVNQKVENRKESSMGCTTEAPAMHEVDIVISDI
jgi:hypothetical protein